MKRTILLILVALLSSQAVAQERPLATKFDTFIDRKGDYENLLTKTQQFLSRLAKEPDSTKGIVLVYHKSAWETDCLGGEVKADMSIDNFLRKVVAVEPGIGPGRVVYVPGPVQLRNEVEFWLVPAGAKNPEAEDREFDPMCCCPTLLIIGQPTVNAETKNLKFFVWLGESRSLSTVSYKWKVSNGEVISGQGTDQIEVDLKNGKPDDVIATVEIVGLNVTCNCPTTTSYTTRFVR